MALVTRLFVHRHSKNPKQDVYTVDGDNDVPHRLPRKSSSWRQLFTPTQKDGDSKWVPTLSGIIKAGDEGLWSSSLFTHPHGHPGEVSFEAICELFASELRPRSMTERSAYSGEMSKFINSAKRGATSPRRVQSMSYKRASIGRGDAAPPAQRKSLDLSSIERGLGRNLSMKRPAPALVPMGNGLVEQESSAAAHVAWTKDGRPAEYHDGRMSVRLTSGELAALSLILGSPVTSISNEAGVTTSSPDKGAFGVSIQIFSSKNGRHLVSLKQHARSVSQMPSSGSGHSPLFAKHLACGSLPFSQDGKSIHSLLITNDTLTAVKAGLPLIPRKRSQQSPGAKFLATLPTSRDLTFHTLESATKSSAPSPLIAALAHLPFTGGLTPLASTPLIATTHFIAAGGLAPGRLLQRLEALVDKVQRHAPALSIFGPLHEPQHAGLLFRERERLKRVTAGVASEALQDRVARVGRYVALLQRLMALVPAAKADSTRVRDAVRDRLAVQLRQANADAVAAHKAQKECGVAAVSPPASVRSDSSRTRGSTTDPVTLGKQVEALLKAELPFDVDVIARVARWVLVAWTLSVEGVEWEGRGWGVVGEKGLVLV